MQTDVKQDNKNSSMVSYRSHSIYYTC